MNLCLIVEDINVNVILLNSIITKQGCQTIIASNGQEAVDIYKSRNDIDLIFMDIRMPVMDGIEATKQIRLLEKNQKRKSIPILALSASMLGEEIGLALEAGCDEYIGKPFDIKELMEKAKKYCEKT